MGYRSLKRILHVWWMRCKYPFQRRVLICGDSNSSRPGVSECWPGVLTEKTNRRIHFINDSEDGRTTGFDKKELNACFCLRRRLAVYGALDNVLIMLGTNDVKQRYGPPSAFEIERNLKTMVQLIERHHKNIQPVFLLPPPIGRDLIDDFYKADERIQQVCMVIRHFCSKRQLSVIDTHSILDISKHLDADSIHLNAKGRQVVADVVHGYLCGSKTSAHLL